MKSLSYSISLGSDKVYSNYTIILKIVCPILVLFEDFFVKYKYENGENVFANISDY